MNGGPSALVRYVGAGPMSEEPQGLAKRSPANQVVQQRLAVRHRAIRNGAVSESDAGQLFTSIP